MFVYIVLLRAINVGGTGKVPMKELKAACEEAGLVNVATYIASGNIVFLSRGSAREVKSIMDEILQSKFGLTRNDTIVRNPDILERVISENPFAEAAAVRPNLLMVHYIDGMPSLEAEKALALYEGPEALKLIGNHLYVDYEQGAAKSKLTPAFLNKALKTPSTSRNWNTTVKLLEIARKIV